jgi:hypothetical protein
VFRKVVLGILGSEWVLKLKIECYEGFLILRIECWNGVVK